MSRISLQEAQAWAEATKLTIASLDTNLLDHLEEEVLRRVGVVVDTTTWVDETTTPKIVRTAISKLYVSMLYDRQYSEDIADGNAWATRLAANAEMLITGIVNGTIELPGTTSDAGQPEFYPTDTSSLMDPTSSDPSLGPAAFSMGMVF